MEKPIMANVCRACATVITLLLAAVATRAQQSNLLVNGGFENNGGSGSQTATGWTFYNNAYVTATNDPNLAAASIRAHSGAYSLNTYNPGLSCTPNCAGSLGVQTITPVTPGQVYKFCGFVLNWDGSPLFTPTGDVGFAEAQMVFYDASSNVLTNYTTAEYSITAPLPLDQWQSFEVIGAAPANSASMNVYCLYVGGPGPSGSAWWDDVSVFAMAGTTNVVAATSQPGVQISYPAPADHYLQVQSTPSLKPAAWTAFGPQNQGVGITNQILDVIGTNTSKFYNVIQTQ